MEKIHLSVIPPPPFIMVKNCPPKVPLSPSTTTSQTSMVRSHLSRVLCLQVWSESGLTYLVLSGPRSWNFNQNRDGGNLPAGCLPVHSNLLGNIIPFFLIKSLSSVIRMQLHTNYYFFLSFY